MRCAGNRSCSRTAALGPLIKGVALKSEPEITGYIGLAPCFYPSVHSPHFTALCRHAVPPIPWSCSPSKDRLWRAGTDFQDIDYTNNEQKMAVELKKDALDCDIQNVLTFSNLGQIKEFVIRIHAHMPHVPLHHLQLLNSLKIQQISDYSSVLWPAEGDNNTPFEFPVQQLKISDCGATVNEFAQLISYMNNIHGVFVICTVEQLRDIRVWETCLSTVIMNTI